MEYMTGRLIEQVSAELLLPPESGQARLKSALFNSHALIKATAKDYVRDTQLRLILKPVAERLLAALGQPDGVAAHLKQRLAAWQAEAAQAASLPDKAGYAAGNLLNLLCHLELDLTGCDFSGLAV
jgi:hypothetical protein